MQASKNIVRTPWWQKILITISGFFAGIFGGFILAFILFMIWAGLTIGLTMVGIFAPYPEIGEIIHTLQDMLFDHASFAFRICMITSIVFFTLLSNRLVTLFKRATN